VTDRTTRASGVLTLVWHVFPVFFATCAFALTARAQPLADRVPQDALLYVAWTGGESMGPAFADSHLKAVLDASSLRELFDESLPRLLDQAVRRAGGDKDAAESAAVFRAIGGPMWRHPSALYFGGLNLANPDAPFPKLALLCDAGKEGKPLADEAKRLLARLPDLPFPVKVDENDGLVVLAFGNVEVGANKKPVVPISARKEFKNAMAQLGKSPAAVVYVDVEGHVEQIDQVINTFAPDEAKQKWPVIRDAIGLTSLKRLALTAGFDGRDWATHAFAESPAPRTGFVKALVEAAPLSEVILKAVPRSATTVLAGHFDPGGLLGAIRETVTKIEPRTAPEFDELSERVWNTAGLDLRADILDTLGDEWAAYTDPATAGEGLLGLTLVNRLKDARKAENALARLEQLLNGAIASRQQLGPQKLSVAFRTARRGDLTIHYLSLPGAAPAWAVRDGNLYVALYPQTVAAAADHVTAKAASILDNDDFGALRKRLLPSGAAAPSAVSFADLPRTADASYGELLILSRALLGTADFYGAKTPALALPTLARLRPHLAPAGSVAWVDDAGWHARGVCPFPGSGALGAGGGVGPIAGVALPLFAARAQAKGQAVRAEERAVHVQETHRIEIGPGPAAPPQPATPKPQPQKEGQ
jgi:hypothetical protein